jgi:hypothetical protein
MPALFALLLVVSVHLGTNLTAWPGVGLIADDRFAVGLPILFQMQGLGLWEQLQAVFWPVVEPGAVSALYRPFVGLLYVLEYPWFGVDPRGYHAVNSLFHCGAAWVWFLLIRRWTGSWFAGLAGALAFVGWPGHAEATHWISARVNLQATCFLSLSLLAWDAAERRSGGSSRRWLVAAAVASAVVAFGSKESAILLLPMAFLVGWLHAPECPSLLRRLAAVGGRLWPLLLAFAAWTWLRRLVLHTWGAGAASAWNLDVLSPGAWASAFAEWAALLLAPLHAQYTAPWSWWLLVPMHGLLLLAALGCRRDLRPALRFTLPFSAVVLLAVAGLHVDPGTLENARYAYEPALAFGLWLGLGLAHLPAALRWPGLVALVAAHAVVLHQNRQVWLRASAVYSRMEREVQAAAATGPVRVFDAPGRYDGAVAYLIENSPMLLWPPFAPGSTPLAGRITSTNEWEPSLRELAAMAAQRQPLDRGFTVGWADGALLPLGLDPQWPQLLGSVEVAYARIGRQRPFWGSELPLQVLVRTGEPVTFVATARCAGRELQGPAVKVTATGAAAAAVRAPLPLPIDLPEGASVEVELHAVAGAVQRRFALGAVQPLRRVP